MNMRSVFWILSCLLVIPAMEAEETPAKPAPVVAEKQVEEWMESVVKVTQVGRDGEEGIGAGWVLDASGLIVTNLHVIGRGRKLHVEMHSGEHHEVTAVQAWDEELDLAILKVKATGLKPLKVGDSSKVKQGQPIAAIGNPEGLEFSFVQGVISGIREIEGQEMIQVAVPIERGNSGGPLLSTKGEVLGVLTLKSMKSENLGFAMPSNAVRALRATPNPVPMQRWMTIGVLDPRTWTLLHGAEWSQRAGVIKSGGFGAGMGGRTLAIWETQEPKDSYEVAVNVKLSDESGAAGLIFCSDGKDRHYGFYPSNGQMRLTRFEGPDVYSWTVLEQAPSEAYKPGEWNELRVRVEPDNIRCWVNGAPWLTSNDHAFRDGKAGLCRFREPSAEFKGFRVGPSLEQKVPSKEVLAEVRKHIAEFSIGRQTKSSTIDALAAEAQASRLTLEKEVRELEDKAASLRKLQRIVHESAVSSELSAMLGRPDEEISLLRAALLLARHDNADLEAGPYEEMLARMAEDLAADPDIKRGGMTAVKRLNRYLFEENGFHVNRQDSSRSNSYINEVLDDREGLPIMLSSVYLELADRLGIKGVFGASLPSRFMVGFTTSDEPGSTKLIDVSNGGKLLSVSQAAESIGLIDAADLVDYLEPATKKAMILRMIRNLMGTIEPGAPPSDEQAPYLSLQIAVDEETAGERVLRAIYRSQNGDKAGAREDISWLIQHGGPSLDEFRLQQLQEWYRSLE